MCCLSRSDALKDALRRVKLTVFEKRKKPINSGLDASRCDEKLGAFFDDAFRPDKTPVPRGVKSTQKIQNRRKKIDT